MSKYDVFTACPLCGQAVSWLNGKTNTDVIMIRTKRKTTNYYHRDCIEKERRECAKQQLTVLKS